MPLWRYPAGYIITVTCGRAQGDSGGYSRPVYSAGCLQWLASLVSDALFHLVTEVIHSCGFPSFERPAEHTVHWELPESQCKNNVTVKNVKVMC